MLAGGFIWHLFRALKHAFARIALMFVVTGLIAAVLVELAGIYETGGKLPSELTHIMAIVMGLVVGYGVSATVLVFEIIRDLFVTVDEMEHDFVTKFEAGSQLLDDLVDGGSAQLMGGAVHRVFDRR
ncbi:MAG TPA: hypothetical protein VF120_14460 [Ktedonobacterales bacterium]